jgi:hypothetical protein
VIQTSNNINDIREINTKTQDLNQKVILITNAQRPYIQKILMKLSELNPENAESICNYILSEQISFNIKESTKEGKIKVLVWLSDYLKGLSFKDMKREDILSFRNFSAKEIKANTEGKTVICTLQNGMYYKY